MYIFIYIYISLYVLWNNVLFRQSRSSGSSCLPGGTLADGQRGFRRIGGRSSGISQGAGLVVGGYFRGPWATLCPPPLWRPGVWWRRCVLVWPGPLRAGAPGVCWSLPLAPSCPRPRPCARRACFSPAKHKSSLRPRPHVRAQDTELNTDRVDQQYLQGLLKGRMLHNTLINQWH